jgi:hypothetical protein
MHKKPAPTTFNLIVMFPMERNTRTNYLHIATPVIPQWLAGTERDSVPALQYHLLFKKKIHQLRIWREFEP